MDNDLYEELDFKEVNRTKKKRKKKHYFLKFLIFIIVVAGLGVFLSSSFFDIDTIKVKGNSYYTADQIINMADAKTGGNLFWGTGSGKIKDRLGKDPYFEEVKIKRTLPNKITIEVKERTQVAAIVYGDDYVVIDKAGMVLRKSTVDPKLTLITGLTISKLELGSNIEVEEKDTMDKCLSMLSDMADGDLFFKKIDVSSSIIKAYFLDTLLVKGSPKQVEKVIKSGDLAKVVNNLLKNDTTRGTINIGNSNYMSFSPDF